MRKRAAMGALSFGIASTAIVMTSCLFDDPFGTEHGTNGGAHSPFDSGTNQDSGAFDGGTNGDGSSSGNVTLSGPLPVQAMRADMSAQSYGPDVRAYATLRHDRFTGDTSPDDIVLSDGDTLSARIGSGTAVTMTRESNTGSGVRYVGILAQPQTTSPYDVIIAFSRTNGQIGAPYSKVTLATPFAITSTPPSPLAHGSPLPIQVAPPFSNATLEISGTCITFASVSQTFDATGKASFDTTQLKFTSSSPPPAGCDVSVRVRIDSTGQVDSVFERELLGTISTMPGVQARDMNAFRFTP